MVIASELRPGMVIRFEGQVYKVLEVESKAGAAKMGGVVKATLSNLHSGRMLDQHMRPQERLEDLELERHSMEFLYSGDDGVTFMNPVTFEQVEIAREMIGAAEKFLTPQMDEAKVETTAAPIHAQQDSAFKEATLENGLEIKVPLFIGPGETVRVEVRTGKYVDRVRA